MWGSLDIAGCGLCWILRDVVCVGNCGILVVLDIVVCWLYWILRDVG